MEARIARIETHVEHLNGNVAELRVASVRLDSKIDDVYYRLDSKIDDVYHRLDTKIDTLAGRMDGRFDTLDAKVDRHFVILGGMLVSLAVGMAGLMAKGFHWF